MRFSARLATLACLALCAWAASVDAQDKPPELKLDFPKVKGWDRLDRRALPPESGGYCTGYHANGNVVVTVYVYNRGLTKISDDLSAKEVKKEMAGAIEGVMEAKRLGHYEEAREESSGETSLGDPEKGPRALHARFRLQIDKEDHLSDIYVLPYRNHFIKIRTTRAAKDAAAAGRLEPLYAELGKLLAK
jgi:hypothetical protein